MVKETICTACGKIFNATSPICPYCGEPSKQYELDARKVRTSVVNILIDAAGFVILFIGFAMYLDLDSWEREYNHGNKQMSMILMMVGAIILIIGLIIWVTSLSKINTDQKMLTESLKVKDFHLKNYRNSTVRKHANIGPMQKVNNKERCPGCGQNTHGQNDLFCENCGYKF